MKINIFIKNTAVLVATSFLLRSISLVFKIYLADRLGSEGMGLYQLIFSVYILASVFASSGISTAVTKLICEANQNKSKERLIMRKAGLIIFITSCLSFFVIFCGAKIIAVYFIKDIRSVLALKILSFSLPFMSLSSCLKGYFLAKRKTIAPSLTQIFEQAIRIMVIVVVLYSFSDRGLEFMAAAVLFGDTVAEICSFLLSFVLYRRDTKGCEKTQNEKGIYENLIKIALPVSGSSYLSSLLHTAENLLIPSNLAKFFGSKERGLDLFGAVKGLAIPVLFFPSSFLTSFSTLLFPEISTALYKGDKVKIKATVGKTLGISFKISVFVGVSFWFLAYDLSDVLYQNTDVGFIIKILAPVVPLMYLESISAGILRGLNKQLNMFWYNLCDSLIRIIWVLTLLPLFGLKGYLGLMLISNTFTSLLSLNCLFKTADVETKVFDWIVKPLLASILGSLFGKSCCFFVQNTLLKLCLTLIISCVVFFVAIMLPKSKNLKTNRIKK